MKTKFLFFVLALFLVSNANSQTKDSSNPPNILCILVDDMGYGDLSFMGAEDMQTPNIDAIAEQGLTFTNFYAILPYVRQVELRC